MGATAKPMDKLTVAANWRYEDIEDKTALANYNGAWTNALNSMIRANGKVDATYRLPNNFRVTAGADYTYTHGLTCDIQFLCHAMLAKSG